MAALLAVAVICGAVAMVGHLPAAAGSEGEASSAPGAGQTLEPAPPTELPSISPTSAPVEPSASPDPSPSTAPCEAPTTVEAAKVVSHGSRRNKVVALTFDDGVGRENILKILHTLQRLKVNATFFPTGQQIDRLAGVWREVARAGFPIANHTYSHRALEDACYETQRRELARAEGALEALGIEMLRVMRPPYASMDDATAVAAAEQGYEAVVLWDVDPRDWAGATARTIRRAALQGTRGSIVVLHTEPDATVAALPSIIRGYRERGFRFVTIGQLLGVDGAVPFPDPASEDDGP